MQSIGERLEEARKRRGISIREASEATKIRGDFLLNFENNQFDVGLPDIYVRGFLRNYSFFLKIDPEKVVTDFNATQLGEAKVTRKDSRELFGRLEIPERPRPTTDGAPAGTAGAVRRRPEESTDAVRAAAGPATGNPELGNYFKIGAIIVAGVVALLVIVSLMMYIIRGAGAPERGGDQPPSATSGVPETSFTLVALDTVHAKVIQQPDGTVLFDGYLARGERKTIRRHGEVLVEYDKGSALQIELNGKLNQMTQPGPGRNSVP